MIILLSIMKFISAILVLCLLTASCINIPLIPGI